MNHKFDELAKGLAQSVTRRGALKKFGLGIATVVLTALGLANKAEANGNHGCQCKKPNYGCDRYPYPQNTYCMLGCSRICIGSI